MLWRSASPDRYEMLRAYARENRKFMTEAESAFWSYVRGNRLGHKFVRQHIIGDYIVDFLCRDKNLVVEIDGGYHSERQQMDDDQVRQEWLEAHGYSVIRFTNEQVLFDTDNTIKILNSYVNAK